MIFSKPDSLLLDTRQTWSKSRKWAGLNGNRVCAQGVEPQLDTHELDHEIKEIMMQIIPVVKQQMNGVCSQQVLHYIQQLTTSLTRLQQLQSLPQGTASPRYAEFSRFFHRQLDSILRDSLAKFEGQKYEFTCSLL